MTARTLSRVPNLYMSSERRRPSRILERSSSILAHAENDRARIVFSPPFRRLQDRTQVFALENNVSIRNRLTHSLEVSHIGRVLATKACEALRKKHPGFPEETIFAAVAQTVDSACLVHDIGNPPFGHFGEQAIKEWFTSHLNFFKSSEYVPTNATEFERRYADFTMFDGNAQGFRILTTLQRGHDEFSLNLTMMLLASTVKYPGTPDATGDPNRGWLKKPGLFFTEQHIFNQIWDHFGLQHQLTSHDGTFTAAHRHPLSYLMEAADDIAYCMSDMEDAVIKGIYDADFAMRHLARHAGSPTKSGNQMIAECLKIALQSVPLKKRGIESFKLSRFTVFRAHLIINLIDRVANSFASRLSGGTLLGGKPLVDELVEVDDALERLKKFAKTYIYKSSAVHDKELTGAVIISGLLDAFRPLLLCVPADFLGIIRGLKAHNAHSTCPALCSLLPDKGKAMYLQSLASGTSKRALSDVEEWMLRAHLVVDYISGMTDHYALSIYRQLRSP